MGIRGKVSFSALRESWSTLLWGRPKSWKSNPRTTQPRAQGDHLQMGCELSISHFIFTSLHSTARLCSSMHCYHVLDIFLCPSPMEEGTKNDQYQGRSWTWRQKLKVTQTQASVLLFFDSFVCSSRY